jgi:hypothetical protein
MTCPTPAKNPYPTRADAVSAAAIAVRRRKGYLRIYLCPCGTYHLTHKEPVK